MGCFRTFPTTGSGEFPPVGQGLLPTRRTGIPGKETDRHSHRVERPWLSLFTLSGTVLTYNSPTTSCKTSPVLSRSRVSPLTKFS